MSNNLIAALEICRLVKEHYPDTITVLGGPGVSFCAADVVSKFRAVDIVLRGEADNAFPDFVKNYLDCYEFGNTKGLVYRRGSIIIDNGWPDPIANLDDLPIPLYELCEKDLSDPVQLEIGRGCPFSCAFCSTSNFFKRKFRLKSVERVLSEIAVIRKLLGTNSVQFNHDLLSLDKKYLALLCEKLSKLDPQLNWGASCRLDTLDNELLRMMRYSGCEGLFIGVETTTDRMQKVIRKRLDLSRLLPIASEIKRLNFRAAFSFISGLPGETSEEHEEMWRLIFQMKSMNPEFFELQLNSLAPELGSHLISNNLEKLEYDEYGSPGYSNVPMEWTRLIPIIESHPKIFSVFHHIKISGTRRSDLLKQVFLARVLHSSARNSLLYAYSFLDEQLPKTILKHLDKLELPPPNWPKYRLHSFLDSLRLLILKQLDENPCVMRCYDAMAKYEIAVHDILTHMPIVHLAAIECYFDPLDLLVHFGNGEVIPDDLVERRRFLSIYWDEERETIAHTEIPKEIANVIRQL
jgi:hypothetical protein